MRKLILAVAVAVLCAGDAEAARRVRVFAPLRPVARPVAVPVAPRPVVPFAGVVQAGGCASGKCALVR